jgi:DNA-binding NarL/FixJ family response regulator
MAEKQGTILQSNQTTNYAIGLRGEYYSTEKNYPKAIENFKRGLDLGLQNKDYRVAISFCESLLKCFEKTNDFENYIKYAKLKTDYEAKQFDMATANKIVLAEEKFESEKKSFKIKTLEKENKLKTYLFWILLVLFILMVISGGILYRFFKTKEKLSNEKQLAAELLASLREQEMQQTLYEKELTEQQKIKLKQQLLSSLQQLEDKNNLLSNVKQISESKSVSRIINQNLQSDENYEFYRRQIVESYPTFFYKLQQKSNHSLTPLDLKYCTYFLVGLETKEIASRLSIEPKSVRMTRYRIKQKLQLGEEEDLLDFIKKMAV